MTTHRIRYKLSGFGKTAHTLLELMIAMGLIVVVSTSFTLAWRVASNAGAMASQLMHESREALTEARWTQDVRTSAPIMGKPGRLHGDDLQIEMWQNRSTNDVPHMVKITWTVGKAGEVWRVESNVGETTVMRCRHSLPFERPRFRYGWMTESGWRWTQDVRPDVGNPQAVELYDSTDSTGEGRRWHETMWYRDVSEG